MVCGDLRGFNGVSVCVILDTSVRHATHTERERERERESFCCVCMCVLTLVCVCVCVCVCARARDICDTHAVRVVVCCTSVLSVLLLWSVRVLLGAVRVLFCVAQV